MSELVFTDAFVSVDGNDISDHVKSVTLNYSADAPDNTVMGDDTKSGAAGGLKNWDISIEVLQDFAASQIDSIFFPLVGTAFTVILRPVKSTVVGAGNPNYTGTGLLTTFNPIGGSVGDLATTSISIQSAGTLSRAVA